MSTRMSTLVSRHPNEYRETTDEGFICLIYQSIETPAPQTPGHSGEFNVDPVLEHRLYFPAPGCQEDYLKPLIATH